VAASAAARGERVLRLRPAQTERSLPYAGIADLIAQLPPAATAALPPAQRAALNALRQGAPTRAGAAALARRLVLPQLLAHCARTGRVLLVLDDVQWLDPESAELIGFAMRRRPGPRVRVVAAERRPGRRRAVRLCPAPVAERAVPPLSADDLTALLESRGLPCRTASRLHEASGGNPFLALALGAAVPPGPAWRPAPLPEPVRALLRERIGALPSEVTDTLLVAALATEPTATVLIRAGRADAERDLRQAAAAGAVELDGAAIRFTPAAFAEVLAEDVGAARRAVIHDELARAAVDSTDAVRHLALRSGRPDAEVACSLAAEAERAAGAGAGRTAAELYLLAADRCPHTLAAQRLDWLVEAARTAATAGAPALAGRAAEAVLAAESPPAHRVRSRLVLIDLAGQALADMGEMFAAALVEARDDPLLVAQVRLRLTWAAMVAATRRRPWPRPRRPWPRPGWPVIRRPSRWRSARRPRSSGYVGSRSGRRPWRRRWHCPRPRCPVGYTWPRATWPPASRWSTTGSTRPARSCCACSRWPSRTGPVRPWSKCCAACPRWPPGRPAAGTLCATPTGPSRPPSRPG
jgi:hypothetical protein